ncbi:glutamyl-tRNA reductase [Neofusicoccum parvum]|uniref:Glutamyl-tRNA reductase n=1 Tax=Neofusicoccum parvum TaxID=310453 RepID=A0ACB5SMC9_9PEZI|nr:glutamyl-tRNA reductase [Neofusicoccum parvum]
MSTNSNTVISLKSAFLRTQTRILSQPLQVPERWRVGNLNAADIPESAIKDVIREVNRLVRRHNKSAYPSLAIRHVAEQIDALYWAAGAPPLSLPAPSSDLDTATRTTTTDPLDPSCDLTSSHAIAALPPTWADASATPPRNAAAAQRYEELIGSLQALAARRDAARRKLARYRRLRAAVAPLRAPRENVQANLVTRDGALAKEVAGAKTLGVRVAARVGAWAEGRGGGRAGEAEGEEGGWVVRSKGVEREKLRGLLDG